MHCWPQLELGLAEIRRGHYVMHYVMHCHSALCNALCNAVCTVGLAEIRRVLQPGGRFYATTFFQVTRVE